MLALCSCRHVGKFSHFSRPYISQAKQGWQLLPCGSAGRIERDKSCRMPSTELSTEEMFTVIANNPTFQVGKLRFGKEGASITAGVRHWVSSRARSETHIFSLYPQISCSSDIITKLDIMSLVYIILPCFRKNLKYLTKDTNSSYLFFFKWKKLGDGKIKWKKGTKNRSHMSHTICYKQVSDLVLRFPEANTKPENIRGDSFRTPGYWNVTAMCEKVPLSSWEPIICFLLTESTLKSHC